MRLEIPKSKIKKLKDLDKSDRERIKKKLDEIENKISDLNMDPEKVIEKHLSGKLSSYLQQRVGDYRLWFSTDRENNVLILEAVLDKEEAKKRY